MADQAQQRSVKEVLGELFRSDPHRFQLEDWRIEEKALRDRVHRKEKNFSAVESEIFELIGLFALFQGVIFSAVAQTNILSCRDKWSPIAMTIIVASVAFVALVFRLRNFAELKIELGMARRRADCLYGKIQDLQTQGLGFDLSLDNEPRVTAEPSQENASKSITRHLFPVLVLATVVIFAVIISVSCWRLLCSGCKRCST